MHEQSGIGLQVIEGRSFAQPSQEPSFAIAAQKLGAA
jgi:hypothetical protein